MLAFLVLLIINQKKTFKDSYGVIKLIIIKKSKHTPPPDALVFINGCPWQLLISSRRLRFAGMFSVVKKKNFQRLLWSY